MGSGPLETPSSSTSSEVRYERFTASYPTGVIIECFYPTGATLHEAQIGHYLGKVEADEGSRVSVEATP